MDDGEGKRMIHAFLEAGIMDDFADYLARGRPLRAVPDAELPARWKATVIAMADAPLDERARAEHRDVASEIQVRNLDLPGPDAETIDAHKRMAAATANYAQELMRQLEDRGPEALEAANRRLTEDMEVTFGRASERKTN